MSEIDDLADRLETLPQKLGTRVSRVILRETMKATGAREAVRDYVSAHFKKRSGTYAKSVGPVKVARVRSNRDRVVAYARFLPLAKIPGAAKDHIAPATLTRWFNAGTRPHAIGKNSRLRSGGTAAEREIRENRIRIAINAARLKLLSARTERQRERFAKAIDRAEERLANFKKREKNRQTGKKVKGITADHFMERIQSRADALAPELVMQRVRTAVSELMEA